ncbi:hypothetical protein BMG05_13150 [Mycobacterium malmoense]|nr:hypothetical protein BMG05_13150 [Mycobacterium malmoense]
MTGLRVLALLGRFHRGPVRAEHPAVLVAELADQQRLGGSGLGRTAAFELVGFDLAGGRFVPFAASPTFTAGGFGVFFVVRTFGAGAESGYLRNPPT